ncbi:MAG: class I SAM-dependent methyltransferase [Clostridia bacterium]|nr:class I SAM-dependent methyltransferase [Clostridia bacterium]
MGAYDFLAEWFETLNDDCDYALWSQYFINGLNSLHAGRKGLELGCGSGYFCRALAKCGFEMTGADLSAPMLTKAVEKARGEGLRIDFVQADAAKLKTPEKYDFIISPNDCYNYIPQSKLALAFRCAARSLKDGGIFWADISSAYKLREKVANTVCADDRDEVTYLAFNTLYENRVEMDVTLFVKGGDGRFDRYDEKHTQYIHETQDVKDALIEAGFEILSVEGHLGKEAEGSERVNFICRKVKS